MPRWPRRFPVPWFRHLVLHIGVFPLFRHFIELSVEGLSKLDQVEPPVLLAANHTSHLDTVAILAGLPRQWRRLVAPAMRQEYFRAYLEPDGGGVGQRASMAAQYWLACGFLNAYPLPQKMVGVRRSLKFTGELIQEGFCPLVFPEGERSPDSKMRPFKPGIGLMAVRLRVPVVPIHLSGLFEILSIHDSWPRTGAVRMRVGDPMRFAEGKDYEEAAREIEELVRSLDR